MTTLVRWTELLLDVTRAWKM